METQSGGIGAPSRLEDGGQCERKTVKQTTAKRVGLFSWFARRIDSPTLSKGWLGWCIIVLFVALLFLPYLIPGTTTTTLGGYLALASVPIGIGALLRIRKGAFLAWFLMATGMALGNFRVLGLDWSSKDLQAWALGNLGMFVLSLIAGHFRSVSQQLTRAHAELQKQALTDALTGLPNHRAVIEQLARELAHARHFKHPFSLLFFDGDHFKRVNDTYGHAVGDAVLRQLGERARSGVRRGDTVGRFGGEEFVVLLPEADATRAASVAERLRAAVAARPLAEGQVDGGINVTVSIGFASYPVDGSTESALLGKADEAMYWAKHLGRNQVRSAAEAEQVSQDALLTSLIHVDETRDAGDEESLHLDQAQRTYQQRLISSLMSLIEVRDTGMSRHAQAVSDLATTMTHEMGLDDKTMSAIQTAALLHDIGKIAIPDALLQKAKPLSASEWDLIRRHPALGAQILEMSPLLVELIPMIRHHHEHWDGTGYPDHLAGKAIPLGARIISVAEAYDAMLMGRPYQTRRSPTDALDELQRCAGIQFDPALVRVLSTVLDRQQEKVEQPHTVRAL